MVVLGLIINFYQAVIMVIVLLNLLIAIITEKYDQARDSEEERWFQLKADMIREAIIHRKELLFCGQD